MPLMRVLLLVALLLTACARTPERVTSEHAPVVLISVDTLRSDHLPAYGHRGVQTPHIDALRRDAVLYQRAYSHCPLTLPSHLTMLTGLLPTEHGVRNNLGYRFDGSRFPTLARLLRDNGYRTGAAVSSYVLRSETGVADGFDTYDDAISVTPGAAASEQQRSGFDTATAAQKWITANASAPFFFFFHVYEPHAPYTAPEPFRSRTRDPYDAEIAAADAAVGRVIDTLKATGVYDRALIIFTSDHGEALWQHGEDQHGILLYREVLQVPLMVKHPGGARRGTTEAQPFALHRIFETILETVGVQAPTRPPRPIYSETLYPRIHLGWSELRSIIDSKYHYIESSDPELYDLQRDPAETANLVQSERRVAAAMRRTLAAMPLPVETTSPVSAEEAAKLAALGYVGTPKQRGGPLPNPRTEIGTLQAIKHAFQLAAEQRHDEAIAAMRGLLQQHPRLLDVETRLAELYLETGHYTEAIRVYETAIAHSERFSPDLAMSVAVAYLKDGRTKEAIAHAELALQANPLDAHELLARAALAERRFDDADKHIRAAIEAGGQQPRSLMLYAELQRDSGALEAAMQTVAAAEARATALGVRQSGLEHLRGDLLARMDRPAEAVTAYEREITAFPQHLQSYANLAVIHLIEDRPDAASRVLEQMVRANPHRGAYELAARTLEAFGDRSGAAAWRARLARLHPER